MCWWKSRSRQLLTQATALAELAKAGGLVLQVGHLERFSAAHGAVSKRMGKPLYIEAVRIAPFKPRGTDVSVILDLMIHDLDLILALTDSDVVSVDAVGAPVASAHDDIANARIRFANGAVATITASRISLKTERKMRIFSQTGYLTVDFSARKLTLVGRGIGAKRPVSSNSASSRPAGRIMTRWPPSMRRSSPRCSMARRWRWMRRPAGGLWRRRDGRTPSPAAAPWPRRAG